MRVVGLFHPQYTYLIKDYEKWRLTFIGGQPFINVYLKKFDSKENSDDFLLRKEIAYCPALAKEGILDIRNSIYQRMPEISRQGGSKSYNDAVLGTEGGVDLMGSTMNTYMGQTILQELLIMGRVGIYVDMPKFDPTSTLADIKKQPKPYLYHFESENIVNWSFVTRENEVYFTHLLLREYMPELDEATGMPIGECEVYRFLRLMQNPDANNKLQVYVEVYKPGEPDPNQLHNKDYKVQDILIDSYWIDIPRIPFVLSDIGDSLLTDISDYQIALLNLASSDLNYALKANFPFYAEAYDPKTEEIYKKRGPITVDNVGTDGQTVAKELPATTSDPANIEVGTTRGRRYPIGAEAPRFIHPSSEPLTASMAKQAQMKDEINELLNLAVSSKSDNEDGISDVDSGLTAIGMELQATEREIAKIWELYFNNKTEPANINYPTTYKLKSDEDRLNEAKLQLDLKTAAPSRTFQKEVAKKMAFTLFEGKLKPDILAKIISEIDSANYVSSDPLDITQDLTNGIVSKVTASNARGYDGQTEVPIADKEHADRLAEMVVAQTKGAAANAARGTPTDPTDNSAKLEKKASQKTPDLARNPSSKKVRGPGGNK